MKAIGYIRVSSDSQADNFSPQVQEELIKVQFQSMIEEGDIPNYVSLEMITDISVSGSLEFAERPAGRNLLSLDEGDYLFLSDTNRCARQSAVLREGCAATQHECGGRRGFLRWAGSG